MNIFQKVMKTNKNRESHEKCQKVTKTIKNGKVMIKSQKFMKIKKKQGKS